MHSHATYHTHHLTRTKMNARKCAFKYECTLSAFVTLDARGTIQHVIMIITITIIIIMFIVFVCVCKVHVRSLAGWLVVWICPE